MIQSWFFFNRATFIRVSLYYFIYKVGDGFLYWGLLIVFLVVYCM
nr:MAG TPA: PsbL protein [Bacteriophage sp.]